MSRPTVGLVKRRCDESGQTTPEYVGLILLVASIGATIAAINLGPGLATAIEGALCRAVGAECRSSAAFPYGPAVPLTDPRLSAWERELLAHPDPQVAAVELRPLTASELAWLELNDPEAYAAALEAHSWAEQRELLDTALSADLEDFQAQKNSEEHDPRMDYSDDDCSAPVVGSSGLSFDFTEACERHDFGYRNAKRLGLFNSYKRRIDAVFAKDMYDSCKDELLFARKNCKFMAGLFYAGVRVAGGRCDPPGRIERVPGPCAPEHG